VKALDKTEWRMGYLDRFRGMLEIPLLEFIPGGDVPWHRVYYFKKGREVMWDRNTRVDKIFGSGDAAEHDDGKGGAKGNNKKAAGKGKKGGQDKGASAAPSTAVPEKVRVRHGGDRSSRRAFHSLRTLCRLSSLSPDDRVRYRLPTSQRCGHLCLSTATLPPHRAGRRPRNPSPTRPTEWYVHVLL
jgi:hypothetical protein